MELKGKKVAFLGDSITFGVGVNDIANCLYDNLLAKLCQLSAVNNDASVIFCDDNETHNKLARFGQLIECSFHFLTS